MPVHRVPRVVNLDGSGPWALCFRPGWDGKKSLGVSHWASRHPADLGMRKLPATTVEDWGKLLGDAAAATAMLDRILHHGHVLKCGPRSWRTKLAAGAEKWAIENEKVFL